MEPFFDHVVTYWPHGATVTSVATTKAWPPTTAALGYAPCVRAWKPAPLAKSFDPVDQLREADGTRHSFCTFQDKVFISADCAADGRVAVWDVVSWQRLQVVRAGAEVTSLAADRDFLAVGTSAGYVRVWRKSAGGEFQILFDPDLQLDRWPIYTVLLGRAPDNSALLVVQSIGKNGRVGVWRLNTGRLVHVIGCPLPSGDAVAAVAANIRFTFLVDLTLAAVSWLAGHDPLVQLVNVLSKDGGIVDTGDMLVGRPEPLCADFDGAVLSVGFADGVLCGLGKKQWSRQLQGAVGAVKCFPQKGQVVSGSADGCVHLWSIDGNLLARLQLGFAPCSLAAGDVHLAVGGDRGEIQLFVLASEDHLNPAQRPTEQQRAAAMVVLPGGGTGVTSVQQYVLHFDARGGGVEGATAGHVGDHPDAFSRFVRPRQYITPEMAAAEAAATAAAAAGGGAPNGGGGHGDGGSAGERSGGQASNANGRGGSGDEDGPPSPGDGGGPVPRPEGGGSSSSSSSKFDMRAALKGVAPVGQEALAAAAADAAKRQQLRQMGEDSGVARRGPGVELDSSTARLGRKCDNPTCLVRQGVGGTAFKRCGACRSALYCSVHCQRTAWRDGHAAECAKLVAAVQLEQQQQGVK